MTPVRRCAIPEGTLLCTYRDRGAYADCYVAEVPQSVPHQMFVEAFYTSALFKVERALLGWFAHRPSSDEDARQLAQGASESFAVWRVEVREVRQLLVRAGRTRSWLMVSASADGAARSGTRLYFGSAVVPQVRANGTRGFGLAFHALLGLHKLYSCALLKAAMYRLARKSKGSGP